MFLGRRNRAGEDFVNAVRVTHEGSINPGGEVLGCPLSNDFLPPIAFRNRLHSYQEANEAFSALGGCVDLSEIHAPEFQGFLGGLRSSKGR
jgi:hypothetical protein